MVVVVVVVVVADTLGKFRPESGLKVAGSCNYN